MWINSIFCFEFIHRRLDISFFGQFVLELENFLEFGLFLKVVHVQIFCNSVVRPFYGFVGDFVVVFAFNEAACDVGFHHHFHFLMHHCLLLGQLFFVPL